MGIRNDRYKLIFFYGDRLGMTGSDDCVSTPSWEFYDLEPIRTRTGTSTATRPMRR